MSGTAEWLLAVIAFAVMVMAVVQVGVILAGLRVARRVERVASELETGVKPLMANLQAMTSEAARSARLAAAQVERFDRAFSDVTARVDRTLAAVHSLVARPARDGRAVVAGVRAALLAIQELRETARRRQAARVGLEEEEESLFIG